MIEKVWILSSLTLSSVGNITVLKTVSWAICTPAHGTPYFVLNFALSVDGSSEIFDYRHIRQRRSCAVNVSGSVGVKRKCLLDVSDSLGHPEVVEVLAVRGGGRQAIVELSSCC